METSILERAAAEIAPELSPPPRILGLARGDERRITLHLEWGSRPRPLGLTIDVDPAHATLHLAPLPRGPLGGPEAAVFSPVLGGALTAVEAGPEPRIRVLRVRAFPREDRKGQEERWTLLVEWTGRSGNIRLLDDAGRVRETLLPRGCPPGAAYRPPSPPRAPAELNPDDLERALSPLPLKEWPAALARLSRDLCLPAALDAVLRAAPSIPGILEILRAPRSEPGLYRFARRAEIPRPGAEPPWIASRLGLPEAEVTDRALESLSEFREDRPDNVLALLSRRHDLLLQRALEDGLRREMARRMRSENARILRLRAHLLAERGPADVGSRLRRSGEAILSHLREIKKGQPRIEIPDWTDPTGQARLAIDLDPARSPADNAQAYFRRARRWERGEPHRAKRLAEIDRAAVRLSMLETRIEESEHPPGVESFESRLDEALGFLRRSGAREIPRRGPGQTGGSARQPRRGGAGDGREAQRDRPAGAGHDGRMGADAREAPRRSKGPSFHPRTFTTAEGWVVLVGRTNEENDYLTHRLARQEDYWFHAHGVPGSHVVLRKEGKKNNPSARTLEEVASIAAFYSKARHAGKVPVIYTLRKYVRKPRGAKAGLAVCTREKTLMVPPRDPSEGREPEWMEE